MNQQSRAVEAAASVSRSETSASLLTGVRNQDPDSWQRLVELYAPLVYAWCRRFGLQPNDASDVLQESFLAVSRNISRFRRDEPGQSFRRWLKAIVRSKVIDVYRSRPEGTVAQGGSEAQRVLSQLPEEASQSASSQLTESSEEERGDRQQLFRKGLELVQSDFEQRTWQAFWRVAVDGQATADVAEELGLSSNSVRQAKSRVLRRLRAELGELLG